MSDGKAKCARCHRPLKDPESIAAGMGPTCAGKAGRAGLSGIGGNGAAYARQTNMEKEGADMTNLAIRDRDEWYDQLPVGVAIQARAAANDILSRLRRTAEEIIEIGRKLAEVKENLPHGRWGEWLEIEFQMTDRTAQRFMNVAQRLGGKSDTVSDLPARVLYALSAPSTPDVVVEAALEQQTQGRPVTETDVEDLKQANAEIEAESALYTHDAGDVARRAAANRQRQEAVERAAQRPPPPKPLVCPACESVALWALKRLSGRNGSYHVQCQSCHHRWWTRHEDAHKLPNRPALDLGRPPEPEPANPVYLVTIRIQPGEVLAGRKCIVAIGEEGAMPQLISTRYDQVLDALNGLLEAHVGRIEPAGEFIDVEVV